MDLAVRLEVAEHGVDFPFEAILPRLLLEGPLFDIDVAEQEETVRMVTAVVIGYQKQNIT